MWSYRDPQIGMTLGTYDRAADFLSTLELSERAVEDYIISCIRTLDTPMTPQTQAYFDDILYLAGRDESVLQKERDELLAADLKSINRVGEIMKGCVGDKAYCTVGSSENINANKDLYDEIIKI